MQSGWIEIFFLAMLAGFIGLRLYHVLGRRTEKGEDAPADRDENGHTPDTSGKQGEAGQTAGAPVDKGGEPNKAPADKKSAE